MALTIKKDLAPTVAGTNGFGNKNQKRKVTVHLTGNRGKGANAKMHAKLQKTIYPASWHIQTDDKESIQSFEYSWQCYHAGDGAGDGNKHSIGIEGCINVDGDYVKMIHNLAETVAIVVRDNGLDPVKDVVRHYDWSGKHCPSQIMDGWYGITWAKFKQMVVDYYNAGTTTVKPVATSAAKAKTSANGIVKKYSEKGVFYPNDTIIVRDAPTTKGKQIAKYFKGEKVKYHTVHIGNGYVWLQYTRAKGGQGYIPIREYYGGSKYGPKWGIIK